MLSKIQILIEIQLDDTVSSVYLSLACFLYIALMTEFHSSVSNGDNVDINVDDDDDDDGDGDGDDDGGGGGGGGDGGGGGGGGDVAISLSGGEVGWLLHQILAVWSPIVRKFFG